MLSLLEKRSSLADGCFSGLIGPVAKADLVGGPEFGLGCPPEHVIVGWWIAVVRVSIESPKAMEGCCW
jgi:hypothetical protein